MSVWNKAVQTNWTMWFFKLCFGWLLTTIDKPLACDSSHGFRHCARRSLLFWMKASDTFSYMTNMVLRIFKVSTLCVFLYEYSGVIWDTPQILHWLNYPFNFSRQNAAPHDTFVRTLLPKQWGLFISLIIPLVVLCSIIVSAVGVKLSLELLSHLHNATNLHLGWIQNGFIRLFSLFTGQHVPLTL